MKNHVVSLLVVLALLTLALGFGGGAIAAPDKQDPKGYVGMGFATNLSRSIPIYALRTADPNRLLNLSKPSNPQREAGRVGKANRKYLLSQ